MCPDMVLQRHYAVEYTALTGEVMSHTEPELNVIMDPGVEHVRFWIHITSKC